MKKQFLMSLAAVAMVASLQANQAPAAAPQQSAPQEKSVSHLSADELAFAAKLNDQNRKVFSSQFNGKQREEAMKAACSAAGACASSQKDAKVAVVSADDAVQKVAKSGGAIAEKKETNSAAAPAVKNATPAQVK